MNLYVKNHNFHFELENLTRLFFPNEKITVIRDFSGPQPPCIYTEVSDKITISVNIDRKSTRLNSSHIEESRMPSSA